MKSLLATCAFTALPVLFGLSAHAANVGSAVPANLPLVDAWDRADDTSRLRGMPMLVVYEDKDSAKQNEALKGELADLAKGDRYKSRIALVAVADVSSYDFWPARGFVKSAIKEESSKQSVAIYCDWNGNVRNALGLRRGSSNVILVGRDGIVKFSYAGAIPPEKRRQLISLLRSEVED